MKKDSINNNFIALGILSAIAWWFLETLIHTFIFKRNPFIKELMPLDNVNEFWMRLLVAVLLIIFGCYAQHVIKKRKIAEAEKEKIILKLQKSLGEIKTLRSMLPICANCKKIRDEKGSWHQLETYFKKYEKTDFTHGICPDCTKKIYSELDSDNN